MICSFKSFFVFSIVVFAIIRCENPVDSNVYKSEPEKYGSVRVWMEYIEVFDTLNGIEAKALDISLYLTHVSTTALTLDSNARGTYIHIYSDGGMIPLWASPPGWSISDTGFIKRITMQVNDTLLYKDRCRLVINQSSYPAGQYSIKGSFLDYRSSDMTYIVN